MSLVNEPGALGRRISAGLGPLTRARIEARGLAHVRANAAAITAGKSVLELRKGPLAERTDALVIAAGPSLHRADTARIIRESGFRGTLIATDSAMSWCLRHGLVPDLVVTVDSDETRIVRWFGDSRLGADALARDDYFRRQDMDPEFWQDELAVNAEILRLVNAHGPRMRVAVASCASAAVVERVGAAGLDAYWWNAMCDDPDAPDSVTRELHAMNGLPCVNAGGNVGTACWVLAHAVLGTRRVGLVGVDFGYYTDTPYSRTQYYRELVELFGEARLDEVFVRETNPHVGREFYTDPAYLWYRDAFRELVGAAGCETHNCTGGGLLYGPGIRWTPLEVFLQGQAVSPATSRAPAAGA